LFVLYGAQSVARTLDWRNERALIFSTIGAFQWEADRPEWRDESALNFCSIRANHRSFPSWINYANDCKERGDLEQARQSLQYLAGIRPENALPYAELGQVLEKLGRPAEAKSAYATALGRDPDDMVANNSLGLFLFRQRKYEEAIPCFEKVIAHQMIPEVLVNLATAYSFTGARGKAEELLDRAVRDCP
jgi:tetratricopeptide (TPR) repeat protein